MPGFLTRFLIGCVRGTMRVGDIAVIRLDDVTDSTFHFNNEILDDPFQCMVRKNKVKILLSESLHNTLVEPFICLQFDRFIR